MQKCIICLGFSYLVTEISSAVLLNAYNYDTIRAAACQMPFCEGYWSNIAKQKHPRGCFCKLLLIWIYPIIYDIEHFVFIHLMAQFI